MKILIAPDSFKESLSAEQVAKAIKTGFEAIYPYEEYVLLPIGDGGEGTVDALISSLELKIDYHTVTGPFGDKIQARYAYNDNIAIFEMADIVGLANIPLDKRNPLELSTRGIGELISYIFQKGIKEIMVAVGGSATNDAGIGMAEGLGYQFYDENNAKVLAIGANIDQIKKVDASNALSLKDVKLSVITDVTNPLCGPQGATYVFAKQKGLEEAFFEQVDQNMEQFYQQFAPEILELQGAGAGGGMAAGLVHFANGEIISGIDKILDVIDFDSQVEDADLVIVGEGRMDRQSLSGKAPIGLARRTPKEIPVIAICGSLADDLPDFPIEDGIVAAFPIISKVDSLEHTLENASENLTRTAHNIASIIKTFKNH